MSLRLKIEKAIPDGVKSFIRKHFGKILDCYTKKVQGSIENSYKKHGIEALQRFDECMKANGFKYTLAFGSVLGAIREHGFIKHDHDIDTWMWIEDDSPQLLPTLKEYGFTLVYHISVANGKYGKFYKIEYKGCDIDIFFIYPAINKYPYCCDFVKVESNGMSYNQKLARRIEMPISRETKIVPFEGLMLPVPSNAEELCVFRYGEHYMTPDPQWDWVKERKNLVEWTEMLEQTTVEKL